MNRKSNLQKSLKKAFEEHKEPLHEAQWDRLSAALGDKQPKRKFFPWLFGLILVVGLSVGLGYWLGNTADHKAGMAMQQHASGNSNNRNASDDKSLSSASQKDLSVKPTETSDNNNDNTNNTKDNTSLNDNNPELNGQTTKTQSQRTGDGNKVSGYAVVGSTTHEGSRSHKDNGGGRSAAHGERDGNAKASDNGIGLSGNTGNENGAGNAGIYKDAGTTGQEPIKNDAPDLFTLGRMGLIKIADHTVYKKDEISEIQWPPHTIKTKPKGRGRDGDEDQPVSRFAIGFTTGISHAVYRDAKLSNEADMHYDTKMVYDQGNQNVKSSFANLFFDVKVLKNLNLTFYSGVQYRQLQSMEEVTYKYNNVPFHDKGKIAFYFFIPDSSGPITFRNTSVHTTRFMTVPLTLGYTFPLGSKNEIQLNGGVVLNKIMSAKGSTFSLNEAEVVDIGQKYSKKISLGAVGGFNYYRQLYKPWWIGVGLQMQQSKTVFDTPHGTIKSTINITNYTFNLKYKF